MARNGAIVLCVAVHSTAIQENFGCPTVTVHLHSIVYALAVEVMSEGPISVSQSSAMRFKRLPILIGVGVVAFLGCMGGFVWLIYTAIGVDHLSDEQIRDGRPCTATVMSVQDTGSVINDNTVYEFTLLVQPSGGSGYEATIRDSLNSVEAGRVGAGTTEFRCVIDRDDASRVEVFWSA